MTYTQTWTKTASRCYRYNQTDYEAFNSGSGWYVYQNGALVTDPAKPAHDNLINEPTREFAGYAIDALTSNN